METEETYKPVCKFLLLLSGGFPEIRHPRQGGRGACPHELRFVVEEANISMDIPFGTEEKLNTFALTSRIADGKSLGFTMPKSRLFRVLAKVSMKNDQ